MRPIVLHATISVGILTLLVLFTTQAFPPFREKVLHPFDYSWPPPPPPPAELLGESEIGQGGSYEEADKHTAQKEWVFDHRRDGNNHGLSEAQCLAAFPLLYKEIDRAVEYRRKHGNITTDDLDIEWRRHGIVRVLVRNNRLYIVDTLQVGRGHRTRCLGTLNSLNTAVTSSQDKLPDVEFTFTVLDDALLGEEYKNRTTLAYSRKSNEETLWPMPDFGFWGLPKFGISSYSNVRSVLDDSEDDFLDKIPKLIWRGALHIGQSVRHALLRESEAQSWSAVHGIEWKNETDVEQHLISIEEHCDYMFAAMTEGVTWSGRLKLLLNCHSIVVSHELHWIEFYHHLLSSTGSSQNYIKLNRNFSDLRTTMDHLLEPANLQDEARRIANNARRTFRERYLTPAAIACYWRALIRGWASVQGFEPQLWIETEENEPHVGSGSKKVRRRPRGTPFEGYTIMEALDWEVPAKPRKLVIDDELFY